MTFDTTTNTEHNPDGSATKTIKIIKVSQPSSQNTLPFTMKDVSSTPSTQQKVHLIMFLNHFAKDGKDKVRTQMHI